MPKHNHRAKKHNSRKNDPRTRSNYPGLSSEPERAPEKSNTTVKWLSTAKTNLAPLAIALKALFIPMVGAAPVKIQNAASNVMIKVLADASNWTQTNSTTYCQGTSPKDINNQCIAYINGAARAAVDVVWMLKDPDYNQVPPSEDLYDCAVKVASDSLPSLLAKYNLSPENVTEIHESLLVMDGSGAGGLSYGSVDQVNVYIKMVSDLSAELFSRMSRELNDDVKNTCQPPANFDDLTLAATIIGGVLGASFIMAGAYFGVKRLQECYNQNNPSVDVNPLLTA